MKPGGECDDAKAKERQRVIHQINPHFVFNTLAAIRVATKSDSDMAYDLIYDLSRYLRAVFQSITHLENISIKEEMTNILSYTNLVKARFGDNIKIHIDMEEIDFLLPSLSVQPLVENAVVHGLKRGKKKGTVRIRSCQTVSEYIVQVEDDGIGFDKEKCSGLSCGGAAMPGGLQRVSRQVEYMAGGSVNIQSIVGYGTVVTLHIPKRPKR